MIACNELTYLLFNQILKQFNVIHYIAVSLQHFLTVGSIKVIPLNVFPPSLLELPENWTDTRETLLEGMVFQLKYLGVTMVEQPKGEELSAAAVKRIVATVGKRRRTHTLLCLGSLPGCRGEFLAAQCVPGGVGRDLTFTGCN